MAILQQIYEVIVGAQIEVAIFIVAFSIHILLFGGHGVKGQLTKRARDGKGASSAPKGKARGLQAREAAGLLSAVRSLQRSGATCEAIASELEEMLQKCNGEESIQALAGLLEGLGHSATADTLKAVREVQSRLGMGTNARLCELLLRGLLATESREAFGKLLAEAQEAGVSTPRITVMVVRAAVKSSDLEAAVSGLRMLAGHVKEGGGATAAASPQQLIASVAQLALEKAALPRLIQELSTCGLFPCAVEVLLRETAKANETQALRDVEELARARGVELTAISYATLIREATDASRIQCLLKEALTANIDSTLPLAAASEFAATKGDSALAGLVMKHFQECPTPLVGVTMVRIVAEGLVPSKDPDAAVLELYEKHLQSPCAFGELRSHSARLLADACLRKRRFDTLRHLLANVGDNFRPAVLLKNLPEKNRLEEAMAIFRACPEKTVMLYNTLLEVCIEARDIHAVEVVIAEAISEKLADVVTYNTIIKAYLQRGDTRRARAYMDAMRVAGHMPNHVTFNELIGAELKANRNGAWDLVAEMKVFGLQPNQVTCSMLLKGIGPGSREPDVRRTLELAASLEDDMDEVLLSSLCETLVRIRRTDLLEKHLRRQRGPNGVQITGAYTFGSVIRAFGFMQDIKGVWATWNEMRSKDILPTSTTLGCMVEALVMNDGPEAGHKLISEVLRDPSLKPLVNAIIYCSVIKGFCHQRRFDRVWSVYKEMKGLKIKLSLVTYNTIIDACARCREVDRVSGLLKEMRQQGIEPNVITYSTIMKGYCQDNRLDKAFELLEKMKQTPGIAPDDFTFNTLLDGCACHGLLDEGMGVLDDMQRSGVRPCEFTLSLAAKLGNRGGDVDMAFRLCEDLGKTYSLSWNVHVYANLIHACTNHRDLWRAMQTFGQMLRSGVRPDVRTYALLLKGLLGVGEATEAGCLLQAAYGLRVVSPMLGVLEPSVASVRKALPEDLVAEVLKGIAANDCDMRMVHLLRELRRVSGFKIDPKLQQQLTSQAIHAP